ncbi:hypothetical protein ABUE31_07405 [Mesorhizobium sp. ZMM04-5]|uniref:Uncharacterized protein n=1 Tax=Mesorhizobium marinum TaxID=3228790 RepID=A0ABV3QZ69_9HYPH
MALACEPTPRPIGARAILDWLRDARTALVHPTGRASGLSIRELRDIGLKPHSMTSTVYRELGKPGLVDFGWRLGR